MSSPAQVLMDGAGILRRVMAPWGFAFEFRAEGQGSGGRFAWGEFVRDDRRLELHHRHCLGEVRYHAGGHSVRHEPYMRRLGVWPRCRYPGFSGEPLQAYEDLALDLGLAQDFLTGDGRVAMAAAIAQKAVDDDRGQALLVGYQGQERQLAQMRALFRQGRYADVLALHRELPASHRLTGAERHLVEIAQRRCT